MTSLIILAILLPLLLGTAFLLGRYLRSRYHDGMELSPVTRQHLELYRGGQLPEAEVEAAKRRFRQLLDCGEVERIESCLHAGTQFVVRVRALAEIGSEEACEILERQLRRRFTDDQTEQTWYRIDLANSLRNLNREESLPLILECFGNNDDFPLVHYFAAETVCFLGFGGYVKQVESPHGEAALRLLFRALEGLRFGVPPQIIVEGRLGEVIESLWDERPAETHPLLARVFLEVRRQLRRREAMELAFGDEPFEQEAFELQMSRLAALEPALEDYLQESGPALARALTREQGAAQRDLLTAIAELKYDAASTILSLMLENRIEHAEAAVQALRWSRNPAVGPFLCNWVQRTVAMDRRGMKRLQPWPPRRSSLAAKIPYQAILIALRGHPAPETEQLLLASAHDWDPTFRSAALSSLGWWEPFRRAELLLHLQDARFDPSPEVRHAARAALARLGERQALQWFRQALDSDNRQRALEAIQAVATENLTLLWPDLDQFTDSDDPDVVYCAREALEQLQEELDQRMGR